MLKEERQYGESVHLNVLRPQHSLQDEQDCTAATETGAVIWILLCPKGEAATSGESVVSERDPTDVGSSGGCLSLNMDDRPEC